MKTYAQQALLAGFLLLLPVGALSAYAQFIPVSGTYTSEEHGVEITFPNGWSGFVNPSPDFGLIATTSPAGLTEEDFEKTKTIMLLIKDKSRGEPTDPVDLPSYTQNCNTPSSNSRTVAGVQGIEFTAECPSNSVKWRMVTVETENDWVVVMFTSPASEFDSNIGTFDSTVASLKVQGAIGSGGVPSTPTEEEPSSSMMDVMVAGESIAVTVESSSTISALALNEGSKMLSFKADGNGDETEVSVGKVLEGPYTVMVDGEATTDFEESTDDQGVKTIIVAHGTGAHDVTVTGTQVVPEFPIVALGAVAAAIGVVSVMGRTRFFKR